MRVTGRFKRPATLSKMDLTHMPSKEIPLTRGFVTIVDTDDYDWVMQWKWYYHRNGGYAARKPYDKISGKSSTILMHRIILKSPDNFLVDHINHNGLDNRKCNLRICTRSQNAMNSHKKMKASSKYKGVIWDKQRMKWCVKIKIDYKSKYLGRFDLEEDAAMAYNEAAKKYHGEFAKLNII